MKLSRTTSLIDLKSALEKPQTKMQTGRFGGRYIVFDGDTLKKGCSINSVLGSMRKICKKHEKKPVDQLLVKQICDRLKVLNSYRSNSFLTWVKRIFGSLKGNPKKKLLIDNPERYTEAVLNFGHALEKLAKPDTTLPRQITRSTKSVKGIPQVKIEVQNGPLKAIKPTHLSQKQNLSEQKSAIAQTVNQTPASQVLKKESVEVVKESVKVEPQEPNIETQAKMTKDPLIDLRHSHRHRQIFERLCMGYDANKLATLQFQVSELERTFNAVQDETVSIAITDLAKQMPEIAGTLHLSNKLLHEVVALQEQIDAAEDSLKNDLKIQLTEKRRLQREQSKKFLDQFQAQFQNDPNSNSNTLRAQYEKYGRLHTLQNPRLRGINLYGSLGSILSILSNPRTFNASDALMIHLQYFSEAVSYFNFLDPLPDDSPIQEIKASIRLYESKVPLIQEIIGLYKSTERPIETLKRHLLYNNRVVGEEIARTNALLSDPNHTAYNDLNNAYMAVLKDFHGFSSLFSLKAVQDHLEEFKEIANSYRRSIEALGRVIQSVFKDESDHKMVYAQLYNFHCDSEVLFNTVLTEGVLNNVQ